MSNFNIGDLVIVRGNTAITKEYVSYIGYVEGLPDSFENLNAMYRIKTLNVVGFMTEPHGVIFTNKKDMILVKSASNESITTNKDKTVLVEFTSNESSITNNDFLI